MEPLNVSPDLRRYPMTETERLLILACGEDSRRQFKRDATNADGLATKMVALANSRGSQLLVGVDAAAVRQLNQLVSNMVSQHVRLRHHKRLETA